MSEPLSLHAESFAAAGGMAADGMKKLLGTPTLSLLETVVRETVQNSWDARLAETGVGYRIGLRELRPEEAAILRDQVFAQLPPAKGSADPLRAYLSSKHPIVMEISDWKTRGLGGPSRANVLPKRGEHNDFVNFVRNMGARRDTAGGGGTYGYGKSSLYQLSQCATVLIDSVSRAPSGRMMHRFIGCHLGDAQDSARHGRLTGRHWWGVADDHEDVVDPVSGRSAVRLRRTLGLPDRGADATGTTLVVLNPNLEERSLEAVAAEIQEAILWYLWPKMLPGEHGERSMIIEVEVNGDRLPLPDPEAFPPLELFVEAYRAVKAGGPNLVEIASERPIKHLGFCSIRRGYRRPRRHLGDPGESIIPTASAHIALMRPVELVVKYLEGTHLPNDTVEWAGVFICDEDPDVEQAFADAEPPAHDDWIPDKMPKSWAKTFVRVALSRLKYLAASYAYPASSSPQGASEQPPLAKAADLLGNCMPALGRAGLGGGDGSRGGGGAGGRAGRSGGRSWRVSEPRFVALEEGPTGAEALFEIDVDNDTEKALSLTATPAAVIDGVLANPDESDVLVPFVCWEDRDRNQLTKSTALVAAPGESGSYRVRIVVPEVAAAGVRVAATEQAPS